MSADRPASKETTPEVGTPYTPILWWVFAALIALRALVPFLPGSWFWGLDALRDLPPWSWIFWVLSAVALVPGVSRKLAGRVGDIGQFIELSPAGKIMATGLGALLVFLFADQVRLVGDFLLRQGSAEQNLAPALLYPQALFLDELLHYHLPTWLMQSFGADPHLTSRLVGAAHAALLALLAVAFARRVAARRAVLVAVTCVLWFGGWLLLFTGYAKAFSGMTVALLAMAVVGLDVLRGKRNFLWAALLTAAALWLHRSALGLLPAAAFLAVVSWKGTAPAAAPQRKGKRVSGGRPATLAQRWTVLGWVLLVASLALVMPKLLSSFNQLDAAHLSPAGGGGGPGWVAPLRLLDDLNLVLFLVPLAPAVLLIFPLRSRLEVIRPREGWFLLALAAPYLGLLLVLQPTQGLFRDFDTMAMSGMAVAIILAVVIAGVMKRERSAAWLAVAIALGSAVPVLQALTLAADLDRGLARVETWVEGPPVRPADECARTWDYLGVRNYRARRYSQATAAFARAAELAPSPRIVLEWATAAEMARDEASARQAFELLLERAGDEYQLRLTALVALARFAHNDGDMESFARYTNAAVEMAPRNPLVQRLAEQLAAADSARGELRVP
jgi:hypothetical protein